MTPEKRYSLYGKKTRNQVKKSYRNSLRLEVGPPPEDFYTLYSRSIQRLGGLVKNKDHFNILYKFLAGDIVCFSLYNENILVGCNYCVRSKDYILLVFNISDETYWRENVNNRLYDEMIAWSIQNGVQFIDFGPSTLKDHSHNHFKEGFGAVRRVLINREKVPVVPRLKLWAISKRRNMQLRLLRLGL